MNSREAFEKWYKDNPLVLTDSTIQDELYWSHGYGQFRKQEIHDYIANTWQACASHYEARIKELESAFNDRVRVIEMQLDDKKKLNSRITELEKETDKG